MGRRRFFIRLFALLAWIGFIFFRSLQPGSASTSESQWFLDLFQGVVPVELSMYLIRKSAHFVEFAVLGTLAELLFGSQCKCQVTGALFATLTGMFTALCDETIQLFVAGRTGRLQDVWLDIAGISAGTVLVLAVRAVTYRKKDKKG